VTSTEFRRLRRLSGLTQEQAAQVLEVTHRTILRWEHGESRVGPLRSEAIRLRFAKHIVGQSAQVGEDPAKPTYGA